MPIQSSDGEVYETEAHAAAAVDKQPYQAGDLQKWVVQNQKEKEERIKNAPPPSFTESLVEGVGSSLMALRAGPATTLPGRGLIRSPSMFSGEPPVPAGPIESAGVAAYNRALQGAGGAEPVQGGIEQKGVRTYDRELGRRPTGRFGKVPEEMSRGKGGPSWEEHQEGSTRNVVDEILMNNRPF